MSGKNSDQFSKAATDGTLSEARQMLMALGAMNGHRSFNGSEQPVSEVRQMLSLLGENHTGGGRNKPRDRKLGL